MNINNSMFLVLILLANLVSSTDVYNETVENQSIDNGDIIIGFLIMFPIFATCVLVLCVGIYLICYHYEREHSCNKV